MDFIFNLLKVLDEKNITAYKLCKDIGIPSNSLNNWKNGSLPQIDKFAKIIKYLNVSPYMLLDIPEPKTNDITRDERQLINEYRNARPEVQQSARLLLRAGKEEQEELSGFKTG